MNKKGFTLVELLAVISILALLVLLVLPNVVGLFNEAKKNSFINEAKTILKASQQQFISDSMFDQNEIVYSRCEEGCTNPLKLTGRENIYYYVKLNKSGKIVKYYITDGVYQYFHDGEVEEIDSVEVQEVNELDEYSVFTINSMGPVLPERPHVCNSFEEDSWENIKRNVVDGYTSCYHVGDTRTIEVEGFDSQVIRISNMSTPDVCLNEGFSQTACGFVIEFKDIIVKKGFNSTTSNAGGWRDSVVRDYLNNDLFYKLPSDLQRVIVPTYAVSGHEKNVSSNYETYDKLYLIATGELWKKVGTSDIGYDSADTLTRQLDYYEGIPVTSTSCTGAIKKYKNSATLWWLRTAHKTSTNYIGNVQSDGKTNAYYGHASLVYGLSPAFKLN